MADWVEVLLTFQSWFEIFQKESTLLFYDKSNIGQNALIKFNQYKIFWSFLNLLQTFDKFITINWLQIWPQNKTLRDKTWPMMSLFYFKLPHSLNARNLISTQRKHVLILVYQ